MPDGPSVKPKISAFAGIPSPTGPGVPVPSFGGGAASSGYTAYTSPDSAAIESSPRKNNNNTAFLSLLFGLLAVGFTIVTFLPGPKIYWVAAAGAIAILLGIIAIAQRISGRTTNVWAPILGILLGGSATGLILTGITVLGLVNSAGGLIPTSSTTANAGVAPSPASSEPFVFSTNPALTADGLVLQQIATGLNDKYGAGEASLAPGQNWPATITVAGTKVTAADGTVIATIPAGYNLGYGLSVDKKAYAVSLAGANLKEVASYASATNRFSFTCASTDSNCVPTR
jgi:hypothetical protein